MEEFDEKIKELSDISKIIDKINEDIDKMKESCKVELKRSKKLHKFGIISFILIAIFMGIDVYLKLSIFLVLLKVIPLCVILFSIIRTEKNIHDLNSILMQIKGRKENE